MDPTAPIHVLHVDDEPDFATLIARHLERESERLVVHTATTAGEAFEITGIEPVPE